MSIDINSNLIKSFNKTFKTWYIAKNGFNSFEQANNLIYLSFTITLLYLMDH